MRYTNWQDVVARYPGAAKIGAANDAESFETSFGLPAEGEIDAALALRYSVPVANTPSLTPPVIRGIATDLAYYTMAWMAMDEEKAKRLRDSIDARLAALACGSLSLVGSAGVIHQSLGVWGTHQGFPNITGPDCVEDWRTSSGELLDVESRRDA